MVEFLPSLLHLMWHGDTIDRAVD